MMRFYTLPPRVIPYPYIIINAASPEQGLRYLQENGDFAESVIIDSGVVKVFSKHRDYPEGPLKWFEARMLPLVKRVESIANNAEVLVVCPDYPGQFLPGDPAVVKKTVEAAEAVIRKYPDYSFILVAQAPNGRPQDVREALKLYEQRGLLEKATMIAVPRVKPTKEVKQVVKAVTTARKWMDEHGYNIPLHALAPPAWSLPKIADKIQSWDSVSWTRPRAPHGRSCGTEKERVYLFITWLHKYREYIELPMHPRTMNVQ